MSKATVLFFAADPLSAPPRRGVRLQLDEDIRRIREKVRAAKYRDALVFDLRLAARADDLLQGLNETLPRVVHFSGHGTSEGLVLVGMDGRARHASAAALEELFRIFRGDIRVVVLNACLSLPQAQAIAAVVGCAIGTRKEISDQAAITFGAAFYRALAFGHSVQNAFKQARVALTLEHPGEEETPQIIAGPGVDPARIFVVRRNRFWPWMWIVVAVVLALAGVYALRGPASRTVRGGAGTDSPSDSSVHPGGTLPSAGEIADTVPTGRLDVNPAPTSEAGAARDKSPLDSPFASPPASDTLPAASLPPVQSSSPAVEPRSQPAPATGSVVERERYRIGPDQYRVYELAITGASPCRLRGRVETVEGGARDIDVLVLDGDAFESFRQSRRYTEIFEARRVGEISLDVPLPSPGRYHLVISNRFSPFSGKLVLVEEVRWECAEGGSDPPA
jgi:hypothetical protein